MSTPALLQRLLTAPGPPGHEEAPATVWREAAAEFADDVSSDHMGSSIARVNGNGDNPLLAVIGHIDEIALRPRIVVAADASEARVRKLFETAHEYCFVANSLTAHMTLQPTVEVAT